MIHECGQLTIAPALLPEKFRSWYKRLQIRVGFFIYAQLSSLTLTVSAFSAKEICRVLRLSSRRVVVVPNCVSRRSVSLSELGASWHPYLLFIGSNQPKKNLDGLLWAWQLLRSDFPGLRLVVRSCLNPRQSEKLNNDIGEDLIELQENLSEEELFALLGHAEALVLPSFHEGFGLPVIEALAVGTPVCVSAGGAMAEVAGPAGFFFDPTEHASIARACAKVLQQRPKSDPVWIDRCRQQVQRFDSDVVISELLVCIRRVLKLS